MTNFSVLMKSITFLHLNRTVINEVLQKTLDNWLELEQYVSQPSYPHEVVRGSLQKLFQVREMQGSTEVPGRNFNRKSPSSWWNMRCIPLPIFILLLASIMIVLLSIYIQYVL